MPEYRKEMNIFLSFLETFLSNQHNSQMRMYRNIQQQCAMIFDRRMKNT